MADNNNSLINGVNNGDNNGDDTSEFFDNTNFPPLKTPPTPSAIDVDLLNKRIADLERGNSDSESRISELNSELEKLRVEKYTELEKLRVEKLAESKQSESNSNVAETIAKRASELEGEVARLQHDLISVVSDSSESTREINQLNTEIAELKREKAEVEGKVNLMEVKMEELVKKSEESENLISGAKEKINEPEVGAKNDESDGVGCGCGDRVLGRLKGNLPVIGAVSVVVVLVGGVMCYVRHRRN